MVAGGYIRGSSSLRRRPSPCSPESEPPLAATRSATSSAIRRTDATAPGRRRSTRGRMWRHPTLAWPYQTAGIPSRASTARTARANPASRAGGTAGSSMKGSGRGSPAPPAPPVRRARAMPERRTAHTAACSAGSVTTRAPATASSRSRTPSGSPLCSTISSASASAAKPITARTAGGRLAGSSRERSISSIADGPRLEEADDRLEGGVHRGEGDEGEPACGGPFHQAQLGAAGHGERALRAAEQARPVGRLAAERLERVARDPAHQIRAAAPGVGQVARALQCGGRGRAAPQRGTRPVGEGHLQGEHVVGRQPVHHRAGAGRVVGDHPAEGRPARRRDVGPEREPVRAGRRG